LISGRPSSPPAGDSPTARLRSRMDRSWPGLRQLITHTVSHTQTPKAPQDGYGVGDRPPPARAFANERVVPERDHEPPLRPNEPPSREVELRHELGTQADPRALLRLGELDPSPALKNSGIDGEAWRNVKATDRRTERARVEAEGEPC